MNIQHLHKLCYDCLEREREFCFRANAAFHLLHLIPLSVFAMNNIIFRLEYQLCGKASCGCSTIKNKHLQTISYHVPCVWTRWRKHYSWRRVDAMTLSNVAHTFRTIPNIINANAADEMVCAVCCFACMQHTSYITRTSGSLIRPFKLFPFWVRGVLCSRVLNVFIFFSLSLLFAFLQWHDGVDCKVHTSGTSRTKMNRISYRKMSRNNNNNNRWFVI